MGKNAPTPTDPRVTSAATTSSNLATATGNAFLSNIDEYGPDGSRKFRQIGTKQVFDPFTGQTNSVPRFKVTTSLSPQQQLIKAQQDGASLNLATLGRDLSGSLGGKLRDNFTIGNEATEARLMELGSKRLNPMFAQRDEDLRTRLANQGIKAGSEAYDRELGLAGQQENDAYNQLLLTGRGQAVNEQLTEDNQRINQVSALLGGGQVSQPTFQSGVGVQGAAGVDNGAIIANNDAQRMAGWQQRQAAGGALLGGLGGLFSLSDERAKDDMVRIGETDDGMGIFKFRYEGDTKTQIGLKAQEVAKKKPGAVRKRPDGMLEVNYGKAV